jgi:flagellin
VTVGDTSVTIGTENGQVDISGAATDKEILSKIASALTDASDVVNVGVTNDGKLSITERGNGSGQEAYTYEDLADADKALVDSMKSSTTFTLTNVIKVEQATTNYSTTLEDASDMVREGGGMTIGDQTYVFTNDKETMDKYSAKDNTTYVQIGANQKESLTNLGTAIADNENTKIGAIVPSDDGNLTLVTDNGQGAYDIATKAGDGLTLQIGDTSDSFNQMTVDVSDMHAYSIGSTVKETADDGTVTDKFVSIADIDISGSTGAQDAIQVIKDAINQVSATRGTLGAIQNRLEHTSNNLSVMTENIQDAESTIRDTDIAEEMMSYTKNNILVQSAQAMLAQANQLPQGVLQLLQ